MTIQASMSPHVAIVVSDVSIKNDIATSISYIHICDQPLVKTVHHVAFVTSTEAELFAIRCGINQACNKENIFKVIVITDSIHVAKKIFDTKSHLYQIYTLVILNELRQFFTRCQDNHIKFWECPSRLRWNLHKSVDKDLKSFKPTPILPNKTSWDYCKKVNSNDIIKQWRMTFQALDRKGRHFLDLVDDNLETVEPSYTKGSSWLQFFSHSNSLCAWATRAITNHVLIGKYCLRFFTNENFKYSCGSYPIETRRHILYKCTRHNRYWNPRRDALSHFIMFLSANPKAFAFTDSASSVSPGWSWYDF